MIESWYFAVVVPTPVRESGGQQRRSRELKSCLGRLHYLAESSPQSLRLKLSHHRASHGLRPGESGTTQSYRDRGGVTNLVVAGAQHTRVRLVCAVDQRW